VETTLEPLNPGSKYKQPTQAKRKHAATGPSQEFFNLGFGGVLGCWGGVFLGGGGGFGVLVGGRTYWPPVEKRCSISVGCPTQGG